MPPLTRSELPELARARYHPIVLFRLPSLFGTIALIALILWAILYPAVAIVPIVIILVAFFVRWQTWHSEQIILTRRRIIRVQGVIETTTTEAFLRVDRISGMRMVQSVPGKFLNYATIELEAPGSHPDVRSMSKIWRPAPFYRELRELVIRDHSRDPNDVSAPPDVDPDYTTHPLPRIDPPSLRKP